MKLRKLGSSDLMVSEVCLGTMTWGSQNTEEEAFAQLDRFLELGGNFIDTAELYPVPPDPKYGGATEVIIGNWLAKGGPELRKKVVLATKVSGPTPGNWIPANREKTIVGAADEGAPKPRLVPEQIRRALEASLVRLKTDYIDLYQLHWPDRYTPLWGSVQHRKNMEGKHGQQAREGAEAFAADFGEVAACMGELVASGKIRAWGVSNETSFGVATWFYTCKRLGVPPPCSIQNDFSLLDRRFDGELAETCSDINCNLGLLAYGALNGGALSGKYFGGAKPGGSRHTLFPNFQSRYTCPASMAAAEEYAAIAKEHGLTPAALALAWAFSRFYMGAVIIGATSLAQLEENIAAASVELPKEALEAIDKVHMKNRNPNTRD